MVLPLAVALAAPRGVMAQSCGEGPCSASRSGRLQVFCKLPASQEAFLQPASELKSSAVKSVSAPAPATAKTIGGSLVSAVIRQDGACQTDRDVLEREIGVACSEQTREYRVEVDADGRIVALVGLPTSAAWSKLLARIRTIPELGPHTVIVRGVIR